MKFDELERVERLHGSVAEYNRVMQEESGRNAHERELDELTGLIKTIRPDLSEEQIFSVIENVLKDNDGDCAVSGETLEFWADSMYPKKKHSYTVEITETLQKRITVHADTRHEAVDIAQRNYRNSEYILDADNYSGVDFSIVDDDVPPYKVGEVIG